MNKYWYVVQNEENQAKKEYLIGLCMEIQMPQRRN